MRTFIAIDLDEAIKKSLAAWIDELRPRAKEVRWVSPAGMHLTLKFLGEISPDFSPEVCRAVDRAVSRHPSFGLALKGTGVFPPGKKAPRVLWAGVEPNPALDSLQLEIEESLAEIGLEKEKREFHPHLTVGRVKSPRGIEELLSELEKSRHRSFGRMEVIKVTFFESLLKPSGAEYKSLAEFRLT